MGFVSAWVVLFFFAFFHYFIFLTRLTVYHRLLLLRAVGHCKVGKALKGRAIQLSLTGQAMGDRPSSYANRAALYETVYTVIEFERNARQGTAEEAAEMACRVTQFSYAHFLVKLPREKKKQVFRVVRFS